jgi:hypothetical protein
LATLSINGLEAFVGAVKGTYTPWAVLLLAMPALCQVHVEMQITFPENIFQPRFVQMRLLGSLLAPSRLQCAHPAAKFQAVNDVDGNLPTKAVSFTRSIYVHICETQTSSRGDRALSAGIGGEVG